MLCLDNNLLSDFLDGEDDAGRFLQQYEQDSWAVSSIVLYEALMGVVHGYVEGDVTAVRQAITSSMDVLSVSEQTAIEASRIQRELLEKGMPLDHPDGVIVASAAEHGATFATAEKSMWKDEVKSVIDIAEYDPF